MTTVTVRKGGTRTTVTMIVIWFAYYYCILSLISLSSSCSNSITYPSSFLGVGVVHAQQINIINVAKDKQRWERVVKEFERVGIFVAENDADNKDDGGNSHHRHNVLHRIDAVDGTSLSKEEIKENSSLGARLFTTPGTIGCYMSHRKFWEQVAIASDDTNDGSVINDESDHYYQIIFEDDVILADNFSLELINKYIKDELELYDKDWDVLLLGGLGCINPSLNYGPYNIPGYISGGLRTPQRISKHVHIPRRPFGTHGYVLSKNGALKLLQKAWYATYHVDCVIWGIQDLNLYICDPLLVYQDTSPSTVGAITSGIETYIPDSIIMDDYTKMTLKWVWNEAVIRIPILDVIITQGRYLLFGITGSIIGLYQLLKSNGNPTFLLTFNICYFSFIFMFNRLINRPMGRY